MKRWQSILIQIGLAAAGAAIPILPMNNTVKGLLAAVLASLVGGTAAKTSNSNPDGTPAEVSWIPEKK